jgi:uncharacterized protein involved in exopolysaccharide biosynthesis
MSEYNDQEIDLRPYIEAIIDKWYWILGLGFLAAIVAYGASSVKSPKYAATALVAITEPRQRVQFDPRIQTITENQPLQAYPELALSDELLSEMLDHLPEHYELSLTDLGNKLEAEPGVDPTILRLTVSDESPATAAEMANIWAELFVNWANQIYGDQGDDQLIFFEEQLDEAGEKLAETEEALISFQARNRSGILENELLALQQTQADYLAKRRQTDLILQDIDSLLDHAGSDSGMDQANIDQLSAVLLQIRALGGVANSAESTMPWQIQINVDGQTNLSQGDQQAILSDLRATLLAQSEQLKDRLTELEPQLLSVQQEKQEANAEETRLGRDFEVATETYTSLSRTVDEKRITSQDTTSGVKLASRTAVPEQPSGPSKFIVVLGAGIVGMILATISIVLVTWWRKE